MARTGKEGTGHLTTQSKTLDKTQYSFNSRFADGIGTNPEERLQPQRMPDVLQ